MSHHHSHNGHDIETTGSGFRLLLTLALNLGITLAQIVGGLLAGSLSLLADAVHNASDAAAIGVSYIARRLSGRAADKKRTFGYRRAETVGALINLVTLVVISLYLFGHAVERLIAPGEVDGGIMLIVGVIAFIEDLISAALLYRDSKDSLNIRSAFLHMVGDTLATLAVILGSLAILYFDFYLIDPILTVLISVYILAHSYGALRDTIRILMNAAPAGLDYDDVVRTIQREGGVVDVHHMHLWQLDEHRTALEAHIVVADDEMPAVDAIKERIKQQLTERHQITHTTLEMEYEACRHPESSLVPRE